MISLTQFRKDLFKILKDQSDVSLELSLRRKIYKVDIKDTGKRKTTPYKKRGWSSRVTLIQLYRWKRPARKA